MVAAANDELPLAQLHDWTIKLARFREPNVRRSAAELVVTILPLVLLWITAWVSVRLGFWWAFPFATILAGGLLVRLFMIQHDCGHGSFFERRKTNDWIGRAIGVLTMTPYSFWRRTHSIHHSTCGNLDRRGIGDVDTLTVQEYQTRSRWGRVKYRLYRHPFVLFVIGPTYLFVLQYRLPIGFRREKDGWLSTQLTNVFIAALAAVLIYLVGVKTYFLIQTPIMLTAASVGVWLFYVQHQFENTSWRPGCDWRFHEASLHGSSYYQLPAILRWFTANIGIHHVHHLCSRIPFYKLPLVLREYPELAGTSKITLLSSFRCVKFALWDEKQRRLISFREARGRNLIAEPSDGAEPVSLSAAG